MKPLNPTFIAAANAAAVLAAGLLAAGCSDTPDVNLGGDYQIAMAMPPVVNRDIDVLFVVDNSGSMQDNRAQVAAKAQSALFDVIAAAVGGPPNLHVGVITTNMGAGQFSIPGCDGDGDGGRLQVVPQPTCTGPTGNFIVDVEAAGGGREQNYSGTLADTFACIVQLDSMGCGFEQPFLAVQQAVSGSVPENAGFLRAGALLVVVFLSDEDDCSSPDGKIFDPNDPTMGPFSSFRCFQQAVVCDPDEPGTPGEKSECEARAGAPHVLELPQVVDSLVAAKGGDPSLVMVATIAGEIGPVVVSLDPVLNEPQLDAVCVGPDGIGGAAPAVRLVELLKSFPGRSWFESICTPDMEPALFRTASAIGDVAGRRPCLRGTLRDVDAIAAGVQPSCRAFAASQPFTAAETRRELRACDVVGAGASEACFRLVADEAQCGHVAPGVRADVEARGTLLEGQHIIVECLVP